MCEFRELIKGELVSFEEWLKYLENGGIGVTSRSPFIYYINNGRLVRYQLYQKPETVKDYGDGFKQFQNNAKFFKTKSMKEVVNELDI